MFRNIQESGTLQLQACVKRRLLLRFLLGVCKNPEKLADDVALLNHYIAQGLLALTPPQDYDDS